MVISFEKIRIIIITLTAILLLTTLLGFTMFLPAEKAEAGLPVADILGTAAQWIITALEKAWSVVQEAAKFAAEKAWDVLKQSWDWIRQNAIATLAIAATKIAAKWLLEQARQFVEKHKIESYLYYADFLVRSVYSLQYITKHYDGDKENQLILMALISEGEVLKNRIDPGSSAYRAIQTKTLLNPKCQTYNLYPTAPDYYVRLLESKGPECTPSYVVAAYRDAALTAMSESRDAALEEIRSGQGYKSTRECGTVVTKDLFEQVGGTAQQTAVTDPNTGLTYYDFITTPVETVSVGETVDVLPTISSAICGFISNPAGFIANEINSMINQVINIISEPNKGHTDSNGLRTYLSDTLANIGYRLLQSKDSDSVPQFDGAGNTRLASTKLNEDYSFLNEVPPGIDANRREGDVDLSFPDLNSRDEQRLRDYWNDMCNRRVPLMFALLASHHPASFLEVQANSLINQQRIDTNPNPFPFFGNYGPGRNITSGFNYQQIRNALNGMTTVDEVIDTPFPFIVWRSGGQASNDWVRYDYLWQIYDPVGHIDQTMMDFNATTNMDQWHSLGRQYAMGLNGFPTRDDLANAAKWVPVGWPYFVDSGGKGYIRPSNGIAGGSIQGGGALQGEGYVVVSSGQLYLLQNNNTQLISNPSGSTSLVYRTKDGDLLLEVPGPTPDSIGEVWKLNKNVSVNITNGQVVPNSNSQKLLANSQAYFVEFIENGVTSVLAAEKLERQAPCNQEPFGPPALLQDLTAKIYFSEAISPELWQWSFRYQFAKDGANQF